MMSCSNISTTVSLKPSICDPSSISSLSQLKPHRILNCQTIADTKRFDFYHISRVPLIQNGLRELRERMETVKNTLKVTEAMKLVAAAKVRRAQEAVINSRPFAEALVQVLYNINEQLQLDDIDVPLTNIRPVTKVALVVMTGDRGLCGGFNNVMLKKAEARIKELRNLGLDYYLISVGKKGNAYFHRRDSLSVGRFVESGGFPTSKEAQVIADDVFSLFVSEEVDKVELLYTKFVSVIKSDPVIHTLLPLSAKREVYDVNGKCVDVGEDEFFRLTTKEGRLTVERDHAIGKKREFLPDLEFEQDPAQILDALMRLYLNSQILRALQESFASELAARMNAMSNATENAVELKKNLSISYNRERQAKITGRYWKLLLEQRHLSSLFRFWLCNFSLYDLSYDSIPSLSIP